MYYLQSRYYDQNVGRFVNSDEFILLQLLSQQSVVGANLFSYCGNDPINNTDSSGYIKINIKWLDTAINIIIWLIPTLYVISKTWKSVSKTASKLVDFGNKLIAVGRSLFKRFDNRLYCAFAKESSYRIVKTIGKLAGILSIVSSIGSVIEYIVDVLDGKWDGILDTSRFGPKLDFTKDY